MEDIVTNIKKNQFTMKIERVTCIWMFVSAMNIELPEMAKKWSLGLFRPNLPQLGLFHPYFVCKSSFRVISMIKMVIMDQSKPISLILKLILHLLCSIIFFVRWRVKKLSTGGPGGNGGTVLISSWKCNFSIYLDTKVYYLDIQAITTLLCLLLVLYVLVPSIHSFFYVTTYNCSPEKWRFQH